MYPFVVKGYDNFYEIKAILAFCIKLKRTKFETNLFFFFPFYHIGGAEKVHLEIVKTISSKNPIVFFTLPSADKNFLKDFKASSDVFELYEYIRKHPLLRRRLIAILFNKINNIENAVVFSCNSLFFYENIPKLSPHVKCIDLLHGFVHTGEPGAEHWSLPYVNRINARVVINEKTKKDLLNLYTENGLSNILENRIHIIKNFVRVPDTLEDKSTGKLNVLFVSRNSPEKRIGLIGNVGNEIAKQNIGLLTMLGTDLKQSVDPEFINNIQFLGGISDEKLIYKEYSNAHVFILLSTREGMPLSIMEAMANGCVIISTNVGGISYDVKEGQNGYLINNDLDEKGIWEQAIALLQNINADRNLLQIISHNNYAYATKYFSRSNFEKNYQALFNN